MCTAISAAATPSSTLVAWQAQASARNSKRGCNLFQSTSLTPYGLNTTLTHALDWCVVDLRSVFPLTGRSQFLWPEPGQPRMPMDEALFLVPAPNSAGPAVDNFCLGVIYVNEVGWYESGRPAGHYSVVKNELCTAP